MIQVRNVSDDAHRVLKIRAAAAGMSLSDYIRVDLEAAAGKPTWEEIEAEVRTEPASGLTRAQIVADLRELRGA